MNIAYDYVRFSTPRQQWGDSERRQESLSSHWLARHPQVKLSDREFKDKGISAWKGVNRTKGALAELLRIMDAGDYLLIENTDRLSREDPLTAMNLLQEIVKKGVTVVTLMDGNEVTRDNFFDLASFLPKVIMATLANQESEKKSLRIREALQAKVEQIRKGIPVLHRTPPWITFKDGEFIVDEEKANVVRRIFKLYLSGCGSIAIAKALRGTPHISSIRSDRIKRWTPVYIRRFVIKNKAVIGSCGGGGILNCGVVFDPPIPNYYPAILDEKTFYAAQARVEERKRVPVRRWVKVNNLVAGVAKCSRCGGSIVLLHRTLKQKPFLRMLCSTVKTGGDCTWATVPYAKFEESFLALLAREKMVREALADGEEDTSQLEVLKGKLAEVTAAAEKILKLIENMPNPPQRLVTSLAAKEMEEAELRKEIELEELKAKSKCPPVQAYGEYLSSFPGLQVDNTEDRMKLRELIRRFVARIDVKTGTDEYLVHFKNSTKGPVEWSIHYTYKGGGDFEAKSMGTGDNAPHPLRRASKQPALAA